MSFGRVITREQRRQLERDNAKQPVALRVVPSYEWPEGYGTSRFAPSEVWRSRDFLVQAFPAAAPAVFRLSINRTAISGDRWTENITWDEIQRLKAEAGFAHMDAVEIYPAAKDVVNVANMRHIWLLEPGSLPFAWRNT